MKMSQLIGQTRKEVPAGVSARSHELLLRGAYIHQVAAGIFSYLPLGLRLLQKISAILREEMEAIGAQEVNMPVVQPADLWQESGRWYKIGAEMGRMLDRKGHDMALAMTHEECTADLVRQFIHSYRDLPRLVYHIQTKWRDDPRPRAGLIRAREFLMKDSYSLDRTAEGLERQYANHYRAYHRIFQRCALPVMTVLSDSGMMGGSIAHEFMYASEVGEDTILFCGACAYSANRQVARFRKEAGEPLAERPPLEELATPDSKTIAELTALLQVEARQCAKMVFFVADFPQTAGPGADGAAKHAEHTEAEHDKAEQRLIAAVLRGDMELNETKLMGLLAAKDLRPAEDSEIRAVGGVPGYASPVGLKGALVVADEQISTGGPWIGGAGKEGFHVRGLCYGRDFEADIVGDLCAAAAGHGCPDCEGVLQSTKAVEVGNIFQLGSFYGEAMGCTFTAEDGSDQTVLMGSYGIGVGRLAACIAEQHNDADGIVWPISVAPFPVHLVRLGKEPDITARAEQLYRDLQAAGVEVLFDDREERPGFKFKDADLIGLPIRLTISKRSLENGGLEFRLRGSKPDTPQTIWPLAETVARTRAEIERLQKEIGDAVHTVEYVK
ncbi:MAG: proline--tRNA ligase [Spirochaetota bacterium]